MLEEIAHFLRLDDRLLTGGMPTAEQLGDAAQAGVQTVINLALPDAPRALANEASIVESLGMHYIGIPVQWESPARRDIDAFMDAMDDHRNDKLLVHCQANYRATAFVALYRVLRLGWTPEAAMKDVRRIWDPHEYPVWQKFIDDHMPEGE